MEQFKEYKSALLETREQLLKRIEGIALDAQHPGKPLDPDFEEQAVERQNDQVLDALDEAGRKELAKIDIALDRIKHGTYDICSNCGTKIAAARLKAVPYTDKCIDCAE